MLLKVSDRGVPFAWVGMDCFYGQQPWFLDSLDRERFLYIVDVPSDMMVWLERPEVEVPKRKVKRGRYPTRKEAGYRGRASRSVEVSGELPDDAWNHIFLRDSEREKGDVVRHGLFTHLSGS